MNAEKFWYFRNVEKLLGHYEVYFKTLRELSPHPTLILNVNKMLNLSECDQMSFLQNQIENTLDSYKLKQSKSEKLDFNQKSNLC